MRNKLTEKESKFIESLMLGNSIIASMHNATYRGGDNTLSVYGNQILKKPKIINAIHNRHMGIQAKTDTTIAGIQSEHIRLQAKAEEKGDLATATANLIARGKTIAAYTDAIANTDVVRQKQLDAESKLEAQRIASIRLREMREVG